MPTVKYAVCTYMHLFMSVFEFTVQSAIIYRIYISIDYIGIGTSGQGGCPEFGHKTTKCLDHVTKLNTGARCYNPVFK